MNIKIIAIITCSLVAMIANEIHATRYETRYAMRQNRKATRYVPFDHKRHGTFDHVVELLKYLETQTEPNLSKWALLDKRCRDRREMDKIQAVLIKAALQPDKKEVIIIEDDSDE